MESLTNEELFKKMGLSDLKTCELAIFCGCGVCVNSGIPTAVEIMQCILNRLRMIDKEKEIPAILSSGIQFELFMQCVKIHPTIESLIDIFRVGSPNNNQRLFSKLVKSGIVKEIVTTNFDQLIEKSLTEDYAVSNCYISSDEDEFDQIDYTDKKINLVKIHGCVSKVDSIRTTLDMVANNKLSIKRNKVIKHLFSDGNHKKVLVMGYSCSDLDLVPQIANFPNNNIEIIYIHHKVGNPYCVFDINEKITSFPPEDREAIAKVQFAFSNYRGFIISCDTDIFVSDILKINGYSTDNNVVSKSERMKAMDDLVERWYNPFVNATGSDIALMGCLYGELMDWKMSLNYYLNHLRYVESFNNTIPNQDQVTKNIIKDLHKMALFNVGYSFTKLGDFENNKALKREYYSKAIDYLDKCRTIVEKDGDKHGLMRCLNSLGVCYNSIGQASKAKDKLERCLSLFEQTNDDHLKVNVLMNLANSYLDLKKPKKSAGVLEDALKIIESSGDVGLLSRYHLVLGGIFSEQKEYEKAINEFLMVDGLSKKITNMEQQYLCKHNLYVAYRKMADDNALRKKNPVATKQCLTEALKIIRFFNEPEHYHECLMLLGISHLGVREYDKAIECGTIVLEYHSRKNEPTMVLFCRDFLAQAYKRKMQNN